MDGSFEVNGEIEQLVKVAADNQSRKRWLEAGRKDVNVNDPDPPANPRGKIPNYEHVGYDFYRLWLDESMTYSCAYFENPDDTLERAQEQNRSRIFKKLRLASGMTLLDLGSGWGHLLVAAAREYRVQGFGITQVQEESDYANRLAHEHGVDHLVRFVTGDYHDLAAAGQQADRIVSVGMYEHIGRENQQAYFDAIRKMLKPEGLSVLQTICAPEASPFNAWIEQYIFPGGYIPSSKWLIDEVSSRGLEMLDFEDISPHYAMTFAHWQKRFEANAEKIAERYGERFVRMWRYYLGISRGAFLWHRVHVAQLAFAGSRYVAELTPRPTVPGVVSDKND